MQNSARRRERRSPWRWTALDGFEFAKHNMLLYSYYGGLYIGRNIAIDANGKPVGYGCSGSPAGQNRAVQEITAGFAQTFWKDVKYGALTLLGQYSYLFRNPWYFAPAIKQTQTSESR